MTRYTVTWVASAQGDLADLWMAARDRNAVTSAARAIDLQLARDASAKGVPMAEGLRALFAPPLRVLFAVRDEDRRVEVLRVRRL